MFVLAVSIDRRRSTCRILCPCSLGGLAFCLLLGANFLFLGGRVVEVRNELGAMLIERYGMSEVRDGTVA